MTFHMVMFSGCRPPLLPVELWEHTTPINPMCSARNKNILIKQSEPIGTQRAILAEQLSSCECSQWIVNTAFVR